MRLALAPHGLLLNMAGYFCAAPLLWMRRLRARARPLRRRLYGFLLVFLLFLPWALLPIIPVAAWIFWAAGIGR